MFTIRQLSAGLLVLSLALVSISAQTRTTTSQQEPAAMTSIIIERQFVRFTTQGEAVEWRLVVNNQPEEVIFDSGFFYGTAINLIVDDMFAEGDKSV
ncbi:MAG TPA: hypothetical protein VFD58_26800 [Blastocatellia bacterium]|nr:hypothetical protein [Blastocatellia bacterium]